ncbi:MAG: ABC transporter permease subunit [Bifidobacteriaceae bacterium]|jgi:hypothetical protein|nr:ABC transporter permease subunit [Bifidobacteriaceae bacterium]
MIGAVKSEFRKLFSTRLWWVLMLCAAGYLAGMGALMAMVLQSAVTGQPGFGGADLGGGDLGGGSNPADALPKGADLAVMVYSMAGSMAYVFPVLVGALSVTQEYRHKTITATFLAEPRRGLVLAAKLVASLPMGAAYGLVCVVATALPAAAVFALRDAATGLDQADTWTFFARALLGFTIWAAVGVGVGALLPNQVAAIVVVIAVTQFAEPLLRTLPAMTGQDWQWVDFLPGAAGDAIQGASFYDSMSQVTAGGAGLTWWSAALVLVGWAGLLAGLGYLTSWRRDVS